MPKYYHGKIFAGVGFAIAVLTLSACGTAEQESAASATPRPHSTSPEPAPLAAEVQRDSCSNCVVSEQVMGEDKQQQFVVIWRGAGGEEKKRFNIDLPAGAYKDPQFPDADKMPRLAIASERLKSSHLETTREVFSGSKQSVVIYITVLRDDNEQITDVRVTHLNMPQSR